MAAVSLEWRHRGDPAALWRCVQALHVPDAVIGIGAPLASAVGAQVSGLRAFQRLQRGRYTIRTCRRADRGAGALCGTGRGHATVQLPPRP
jgi:hypothetical protein